MVHATIARKLFIKHSADGPVEVIDDIAAVRQKLYEYATLPRLPVA